MPLLRRDRIEKTLLNAIDCRHLEVVNESANHHVPKDAETHFKVIIVSDSFDSQSLITRHRTINELLFDEFALGLHALSIHAYTMTQWQKKQSSAPASPTCLDGFKHNE